MTHIPRLMLLQVSARNKWDIVFRIRGGSKIIFDKLVRN